MSSQEKKTLTTLVIFQVAIKMHTKNLVQQRMIKTLKYWLKRVILSLPPNCHNLNSCGGSFISIFEFIYLDDSLLPK